MAVEYTFQVVGDSDWNLQSTRSFPVYFTEPEQKREVPPGILLLIAGYGGNATSKVYQKMRSLFAETYNLYVVQCNYMGWEFMKGDISEEDKELLESNQVPGGKIEVIVDDMGETEQNYNDMGPFQALDNLIAIKSLMTIIKENGKQFDTHRIGCWGHSHGAYLCHLCNCFFPNLFTDVLDISSWVYPVYLKEKRLLIHMNQNTTLIKQIKYRITERLEDKEIYDLMKLYAQFHNNAYLLCFQGVDDILVSTEGKKALLDEINNSTMLTIEAEDVDGEIFKSTQHGLGADFLKLFQYAVDNWGFLRGDMFSGGNFDGNILKTQQFVYESRLNNEVPELCRKVIARID